MLLERIYLKVNSSQSERFIKIYDAYYELHDLYLKKVFICDAEVPKDSSDVLGAWEEIHSSKETIGLRSAFCGIEKFYVNKTDSWEVDISFNGVANELHAIFKTEKKATDFKEKILAWGLGMAI